MHKGISDKDGLNILQWIISLSDNTAISVCVRN
jgi:hypothetical protein